MLSLLSKNCVHVICSLTTRPSCLLPCYESTVEFLFIKEWRRKWNGPGQIALCGRTKSAPIYLVSLAFSLERNEKRLIMRMTESQTCTVCRISGASVVATVVALVVETVVVSVVDTVVASFVETVVASAASEVVFSPTLVELETAETKPNKFCVRRYFKLLWFERIFRTGIFFAEK